MMDVEYTICGTQNLRHVSVRKYSISQHDSAATAEASLRLAVGVLDGTPLRMLKEVPNAETATTSEDRLSAISFQALYLSTMKYMFTGQAEHLCVPSRRLLIDVDLARNAAQHSMASVLQ